MKSLPKPTDSQTDAWEKLPKSIQRSFLKRKVRPFIILGGEQLYFAEVTSDRELKVLASAQAGTNLGDVAILGEVSDGTFDYPHLSGEALHTKEAHNDSTLFTETELSWTNDSAKTLRTAAKLSTTLDAYLYQVVVYVNSTNAFGGASTDSLFIMIDEGAAARLYFCETMTFDDGATPTTDGTTRRWARTFPLPNPPRIPANTNVRIYGVNSLGATVNVIVHAFYYLE